MDRRKFMLGVGAAALAPVVTPVVLASPVVGGPPMSFGGIVRTGLPPGPWRRLYQGIPVRRVGNLIVEDWSRPGRSRATQQENRNGKETGQEA